MKKILAMILALTMTLSCCAAFAEATEAPKYKTVQLTLNVDAQMVQMLAGSGNATVDAVVGLLNKLTIGAEQGANNSGRMSVLANGGSVVSFTYVTTETGLVLTSDLFPSCALTIPASMLEKVAPISSAANAEEALAGVAVALGSVTDAMMTGASEPVVGEFPINGVTYTSAVEVTITGEMMNTVLGNIVEAFNVDLAKLGVELPDFAAQGAQIGLVMYTGEELPSIACDVALIQKNVSEEADAADTAQHFLFEMGSANEAASISLYLPSSQEYETWDAAIAALNAGEDSGFVLKMETTTAGMSVTLYNGGQYLFGLVATQVENNVRITLSLSAPEAILLTADITTVTSDTPADIVVDTANLTAIDIQALLDQSGDNAELIEAFQTDLSYGISVVIANLAQLLPDEMTAFMNAVYPAEETTEETPVVPAA